jgi:NhaP-type Na+/H+ or K+/H+ antiporter
MAVTKSDDLSRDIQLETNFFYMVLLPPIIFEGGLTLQRVAFLNNLFVIVALALFGGIYSTVLTSLQMYLFTRFLAPDWSLLVCFLFGAIISSTDPISVLGMLPPATDRNLYMLIVGESALNDAVAIILYKFFGALVEDEQSGISFDKFLISSLASFLIFIGSTVVGIVVALLYALLTKHIRSHEQSSVFQLLMMLVFAYVSYLAADLLGLTGIISIFVTGLAMAHYGIPNISKVAVLSSRVALRSISSMCDSFVFLYIGLGLFAFGRDNTKYDPLLIFCGCVAVLVSRTHVFIIAMFNNAFAKVNPEIRIIPPNQQIFLWFCGLRGAVSFALARETLDNEHIADDVKATFFGTAIMIVFATVVGMGGLTPFMLRVLKLDGSDNQEHSNEGHSGTGNHGERKKSGGSLQTVELYMPSKDASAQMDTFWKRVLTFDKKYFRPFFVVKREKKKHMGSGAVAQDNDSIVFDDGASVLRKVQRMEEELDGDFGADDDSEDELDKIPLSIAAEMFGIGPAVQVATSANQVKGRSRAPSNASFLPPSAQILKTAANKKPYALSTTSLESSRAESLKTPPLRAEAKVDSPDARRMPPIRLSSISSLNKKRQGNPLDQIESDEESGNEVDIPLDDDNIKLTQ